MRWQRSAYLPLATLAVFGVAVAVLLARSPLNEMPDTYCETVLQSPGGGCAAVAARRWRWIAWVLGFAVVLAAAAVVVGRRWRPRRWGRGPMIALRVAALVWMLVAVSFGIAAGSYLTIGVNGGICGSTLSRVDERGVYNRDQPVLCAPSYAASRAYAWKLGLVGLAAFVAGTVAEAIDCRGQHRRR